ncbi:MAG TPA: Wzz/FepE/Etk N-terminal domain-containing protein [Gemmatimonadales bacterium]|nr:Wzz/FepE/Etk N-terminal domain-containing protein [Gemmatimonadales bacterium]
MSAQHHYPMSPSPVEPTEPGEVSLLAIVNVLLRHRGLIAGTALLLAIVVSGVILLLPRTFTAESTLTPQSRRMTSNLSGLAAQFGLALPGADAGQSPAFYADLLSSHQILGQVVDTKFEYPSDTGVVRGTLVQIYRAKGDTPPLRRDAAIRRLAENVDATTVQKTGVIELAVQARHPVLAQLISQRLIALLDQYNLHTRQSQAAAERRFTEQRLDEVRRDLRAAEDALQRFLQRNRDYRNSPELAFEQERLKREVSLEQQLYSTLAEAFEQAKIEEVRDTPVITVVEPPEAPVRPDPRGLLQKGLLALVLGALLGMALAIGHAYAVNARSLRAHEASEFERLRHDAFQDLTRPWRPLSRAWRRSKRTDERHSDTSMVTPEP